MYSCRQNKWTSSTVIATDSGKEFVGYLMKQMEAVLRKVMHYKFKLSANIHTVTHTAVGKLHQAGLSLESMIADAVMEFYREATKTVVNVDLGILSIIRQEALVTQEKLIVPEQSDCPYREVIREQAATPQGMPPLENERASMSDAWEGLKNILTETEIGALSIVLHGEIEIKKFADACGIMLEVLVDGINEKAMDCIGDNLMDEEFVLYDDYIKQVKEMVG
jgi:hypothetical protein